MSLLPVRRSCAGRSAARSHHERPERQAGSLLRRRPDDGTVDAEPIRGPAQLLTTVKSRIRGPAGSKHQPRGSKHQEESSKHQEEM
jgi:hypothetical protein